MLPVGFGWSAGDVAIAIRVLVKVGKAFRHAGGAATQYREAVAYLESLRTTLDHLAQYAQTQTDDFYVESISKQLESIEKPWSAFASFLARFEAALGHDPGRSTAQRAPRTIQYALKDLSGEIDKLKAAISHPLQVVNIMLTLQHTQNSATRQHSATERESCVRELQERYSGPLSEVLKAQLERLEAAQETRLASLTEAVKHLSTSTTGITPYSSAECTQATRSLETLPDSACDTDLPSVFSADSTSVYTADSDFGPLNESTKPGAGTAASFRSMLIAPRLSIYGYRHLNASEWKAFFVPGRMFLMRSGTAVQAAAATQLARQRADAQPSQGLQRFLVIRARHSDSLCAAICHYTRHSAGLAQQLGPYEIPLCNNINSAGSPSTSSDDALSFEMQQDNEHGSLQLPPHAHVKLRVSFMVQHSAKVMGLGLLADDDRELLQELWNDANPGDTSM